MASSFLPLSSLADLALLVGSITVTVDPRLSLGERVESIKDQLSIRSAMDQAREALEHVRQHDGQCRKRQARGQDNSVAEGVA